MAEKKPSTKKPVTSVKKPTRTKKKPATSTKKKTPSTAKKPVTAKKKTTTVTKTTPKKTTSNTSVTKAKVKPTTTTKAKANEKVEMFNDVSTSKPLKVVEVTETQPDIKPKHIEKILDPTPVIEVEKDSESNKPNWFIRIITLDFIFNWF